MTIMVNEPLVRNTIKQEKLTRKECRIYLTPSSELTEEEKLLVDLALNNTAVGDTVLPEEYEKILLLSTSSYYQVADTKVNPVFNKIILVMYDANQSKINIYVYDKPTDKYTVKQFLVVVPEFNNKYVISNLSKNTYTEAVVRLRKEQVFQYSEGLADIYRLLFHIVFQTDLSDFVDNGRTEEDLVSLLDDTEITLHLDITRTVKLYGNVDDQKFLNLNIREIGTPDTFWTNSALLPEITNQI